MTNIPQNSDFVQFIDFIIEDVSKHVQCLLEIGCTEHELSLFHEFILICQNIKEKIINYDLKANYSNKLKEDIRSFTNSTPFFYFNATELKQLGHSSYIGNLNNNIKGIHNKLDIIKFTFHFFNLMNYFSSNIVAIGANGSGKTSLSTLLKNTIGQWGAVISAQRILQIPDFDTFHNPQKSATELKQLQTIDKSNKSKDQQNYLNREFEIVLKNLFAENMSIGNSFRKESVIKEKNREQVKKAPVTKLDRTLEIWNSLIEHRTIKSDDGITINVETKSAPKASYPAIQMSDGEKVVLFLVSQVIQAPENGFIIIDEPEMYLHKSILKKLWDILEHERSDTIFIYLTHDLEFAASRTDAKKVWIKSFSPPEQWEFEDIPQNDLPEALLLELLGSKKTILFCEGVRGGRDEKLYNIIFPEYTITPVNSCSDVINYTKVFNKIANTYTNAIGIIDSDYHSNERLKSLREERIYSIKMTEIENLFFDDDFLKELGAQLLKDPSCIDKIKTQVLDELSKSIELQISNYLSSRITNYFVSTHMSKGNTLAQVESNYQNYLYQIEIRRWYDERKKELEKIISEKNYIEALAVFNNKGLLTIINRNFNISDFTERAFSFLKSRPELHSLLRRHFPDEISQK